MITPEEEQRIIDKAAERALLALPDAWANLALEGIAQKDVATKFYEQYPEFKGHGEAVRSCISMVDGKHPLIPYKEKLEKAVPEIRKRLQTMKGMDMENVNSNVNRSLEFQAIQPPSIAGSNGAV